MQKKFKPVVINGSIAEVRDGALYAAEDAPGLDFELEDLVSHNAFIKSLTDKRTRDFNLENLFEQNLRPLIVEPTGKVDINQTAAFNKALFMAENSLNQPVATTTVSVLSSDRQSPVAVHVVINNQSGRTLVIGEGMPRGLRQAFVKANIDYVDRHAKQALPKVRKSLAEIAGNEISNLGMAFKFRNMPPSEAKEDLAAMMVSKKTETSYTKYIVKR